MATHSSVLAWRIPGTGEPGGLPSMGSHRVGHDCRDLAAAVYLSSSRGMYATCSTIFTAFGVKYHLKDSLSPLYSHDVCPNFSFYFSCLLLLLRPSFCLPARSAVACHRHGSTEGAGEPLRGDAAHPLPAAPPGAG